MLRFDTPAYGAADSRLAQLKMGDANGVTLDSAADGELRLPDGQTSGSFVSRLLDAEQMVQWRQASWNATVPAGTSVTVSVRTGSTKTPDSSWSDWYTVPDNGASLTGHAHDSRFLQYRIELTGTGQATPIVRSIGFTSSGSQPQYPTEGGQTGE